MQAASTKTLPRPKANISGTGQPRSPKGRRFDPKAMLASGEMQAALGSGALMLIAWGIGGWSQTLSVILYMLAYAVGGWQKAKEGVETLVKERDLDVNLLMIAAALGAAAIGYWNEGAMLIFIFALSGALESYTNERSRKDLSALLAMKPNTAIRIEQGAMNEVPIERLEVDDLLLVRPGEVIPADGCVCAGLSAVNQASITGESVPEEKGVGSEVFAGTVNGEGALHIEVTKPMEQTLFAKIIRLVAEAETEVPSSQRFIKRFEALYARGVVLVTLVLLLAPPLVLGWSWGDTFYKAMVFLVVASPCALVSSIMPATLSAVSKSARKGVLFKGGVHLENLAGTAVVAFDKTGTLTEGEPRVTDFVPAPGFDRGELLALCASMERTSRHPLAEAVVRLAEEEELELRGLQEMRLLTGWGIEGEIDGVLWQIGKTDVLDRDEAMASEPEVSGGRLAGGEELEPWRDLRSRMEKEGKTVSVVLKNGVIAALIGLKDTVRPQAREAVRALQAQGVKVAMLTGDRAATAARIAEQTGVDIVYADLLPEDKVSHVRRLREQYGHVVMVGDGVNDAPALAQATVGIGMGMKGSGAALEVADAVLMNDNIEEIAATLALARRTQRVIKANIVFAVSMIALLLIGNFAQGIALPLGVIGHEGSTLLVILNGLRLLR